MKISPLRTRIFREGEDLMRFIHQYVPHLKEKSVLVVTSKIIALAEGRTASTCGSSAAQVRLEKERLIKKESDWAIKTKYTWLTIKDGMVMASAGIDESNANGKLILLPSDSFTVADTIRTALKKHFHLKDLGVILTDSRLMPLRAGITGVALGYVGFKGIKDYRGTPDIFGRKLKITKTDIADSLAAAAVLTMGEGKEQQPLAIIEDAPIQFTDRTNRNELKINPKEDIYAPLFKSL